MMQVLEISHCTKKKKEFNLIKRTVSGLLKAKGPRQTKVFKTGSSGFSPLALRIVGIAARLARQCQDNGWLSAF